MLQINGNLYDFDSAISENYLRNKKCREDVLSLQPMIPPKLLEMCSPCLGDAQKV